MAMIDKLKQQTNIKITLTVYYNESEYDSMGIHATSSDNIDQSETNVTSKVKKSVITDANETMTHFFNSVSPHGKFADATRCCRVHDSKKYPIDTCQIYSSKKVTAHYLATMLGDRQYIYNPIHYTPKDEYENIVDDEYSDDDDYDNNEYTQRYYERRAFFLRHVKKIHQEKHKTNYQPHSFNIKTSHCHTDQDFIVDKCDDCGNYGILRCVSACNVYNALNQKCCYKYVCYESCTYKCSNNHAVKISHKELSHKLICSECGNEFNRKMDWNDECLPEKLNTRRMEESSEYPHINFSECYTSSCHYISACDRCHQNDFLRKHVTCSQNIQVQCLTQYLCKNCYQ
jgi:hypothetical protein